MSAWRNGAWRAGAWRPGSWRGMLQTIVTAVFGKRIAAKMPRYLSPRINRHVMRTK